MSWGVATRNGVSIGVGSVVSLTSLASGGGPAPTYDYFMSLVASASGVGPATLSVDSSDQAVIFGQTANGGLELQLGSTGLVTLSKEIAPTNGYAYYGTKDSAGNYYVAGLYDGGGGCLYFPEVYKFNSSLGVTTSVELSNFGYIGASPPVIDSSGNIWVHINDYTYYGFQQQLVKLNTSLVPQAAYSAFTYNGNYYYYLLPSAATSTGNLIIGGTYAQFVCGCCCYPTIQGRFISSLPVSNPTGTPNWGKTFGFAGYIQQIAVDSSNNVYVAQFVNSSLLVTLYKFNSSGVLQWQTEFNTSGLSISNIVFDSLGFVYCVGNVNNSPNYQTTIIKVHPTSGLIQWVRDLYSAIHYTYGNSAYIKDDKLYVIGAANLRVGGSSNAYLIKLPIDGTLTQTISIGGYSFIYAAGTTTQTTSTYPVFSSSNFNVITTGTPTASTVQTTISDITTTSSRANL